MVVKGYFMLSQVHQLPSPGLSQVPRLETAERSCFFFYLTAQVVEEAKTEKRVQTWCIVY